VKPQNRVQMIQIINFKNTPKLLALALICSMSGWAQSGSSGNTYIFGGGQPTVHGGNFSFLAGGSGVLPGIVGTDRTMPAGYLAFMNGTTWSDASNGAHVDGYVRSYATGKFVFPIGDNGKYNPAAVSQASLSSPADAAYYAVDPGLAISSSLKGGNEPVLPVGGPFASTSKVDGVSGVSTVGYWDINGETAAKITLSWNPATDISKLTASELSNLKIVGWDGTKWVEIPAKVDKPSILGGNSSLDSGSITTNSATVPNTYSVYTLASGVTDACNDAIGSPTWNLADCDHDGLPNGEEIIRGTDPYNPDTDGDGVLDGTEVTDGTNPLDPCSLIPAHITRTPSAAWKDQDCDNDGLPNGEEIEIHHTDPLNPDTDGDGILDGTEVTDGTDPLDPCSFVPAHITRTPSAAWKDQDCDNDGLPNGEEIEIHHTDPLNPDTDGDGVTDGTEVTDKTDPLDVCDSKQEHKTLPHRQEYINRDCKVDGANGLEVFNAVTPNGDGSNDVLIIKGLEFYPDNTIQIFNRWGVKVYETEKYGQNGNYFTGLSEGRATVSQSSGLPSGTYFYILKCSDDKGNKREKSGYIHLNR